jgi:hypothetical protein
VEFLEVVLCILFSAGGIDWRHKTLSSIYIFEFRASKTYDSAEVGSASAACCYARH